eukprot:m.359534 g.359534  ORF g.359534 m.359534 type:complete len:169 (-) comp55996_c0_seq8:142-648(-)
MRKDCVDHMLSSAVVLAVFSDFGLCFLNGVHAEVATTMRTVEAPAVVIKKIETTKRKTQAELLAGSIKRKSQSNEDDNVPAGAIATSAEPAAEAHDPPAKHRKTSADTAPPSTSTTAPSPTATSTPVSSVPAVPAVTQAVPKVSKLTSLLGDYGEASEGEGDLDDEFL